MVRQIDAQHRVVGAWNDRETDNRAGPGAATSMSYPQLLEALLNLTCKLCRLFVEVG